MLFVVILLLQVSIAVALLRFFKISWPTSFIPIIIYSFAAPHLVDFFYCLVSECRAHSLQFLGFIINSIWVAILVCLFDAITLYAIDKIQYKKRFS